MQFTQDTQTLGLEPTESTGSVASRTTVTEHFLEKQIAMHDQQQLFTIIKISDMQLLQQFKEI